MDHFVLARPRINARQASQGFTLVEALVVVALLGILAALAGPSFSDTIDAYRVNAARDNLINSIQLARAEAIRTGQPVVIRNRTDCALNNWGCGWFFFVDRDNNDVQSTTDPRERTVKITEAQRGVTIVKSGSPAMLQINAFGQAFGQQTRFNIGPTARPTDSPGCAVIVVATTLRIRVNPEGVARCPS